MRRSACWIMICAMPASPRWTFRGRPASNLPPITPGRPRRGPLWTAFWRSARCDPAEPAWNSRASSPDGARAISVPMDRDGALASCFDAFSLREPVSTSLENALNILAWRCLARASSVAITSVMTEQPLPIGPADIDAAARVIAPFAILTPLLSFPVLNERVPPQVFLKPEMLQRTGSFKFRGAFNKVASIPQDKRAGGVVAFSSGNHAQGVAAAAKILDMQATIVMPADAPLSKRERTKSYGAEVVLYDRDRDDREAISRGIAEKRGATLVRPYDDPFVIAGQGTAGREIAEDMAALGLSPDIVVAPASGGGLIAGVATAVKARYPQAQIVVAEPEACDDHGLSLTAGHREPHAPAGRTICDALMALIPGEMTFAINSKLLARGVTASDKEVGAAVAFAYRELKLVVEPGGAVGLAALLAGRLDVAGKNVVIVLSGGNVDADLFAELVA